ncbi:hypothetical protein L9F63_009549, partial [Diploptera punctata]
NMFLHPRKFAYTILFAFEAELRNVSLEILLFYFLYSCSIYGSVCNLNTSIVLLHCCPFEESKDTKNVRVEPERAGISVG